MEKFMDLVDRDDLCIPHEYLFEYKVATESTTTSNILKMLKARGLIEGEDFELLRQERVRPQGGTTKKNIYMLTPDAFKRCLQGSAITKVYSNYFLFTEKAIKYYSQYQIKVKDIKISSLSDDLKELIKINKDTNKELKITNKQLILANKELTEIKEINIKQLEELKYVKKTLYVKSHDRAVKVTTKPQLNDVLILLKNELIVNNYCSLRTQKGSVNKAIRDKNKTGKICSNIRILI